MKFFNRGHGTYNSEDDRLLASVAGVVERVNKLICVKPLKTRYICIASQTLLKAIMKLRIVPNCGTFRYIKLSVLDKSVDKAPDKCQVA